MTWDDYDVFCYVVEYRNFSAAARAMGRPKSSVTAAIGRLEAGLGVRLLERSTRQCQLTERGDALYDSVGDLFGRLRSAQSTALARGTLVSGTLRIAGPPEFATHQLGPVVCTVMARYAQLNVTIDIDDTTIDPIRRRHDIVFTRLDGEQPASSLSRRHVYSFERGIFASPAFLQHRGEPTGPHDIREYPLICALNEREWNFTTANGDVERVRTPSPRFSTSNTALRLQAAEAGLGIARLPPFIAEAAVTAGRLRRLLPGFVCEPLNMYALFPSNRLMPAKVHAFLDALELHAAHTR